MGEILVQLLVMSIIFIAIYTIVQNYFNLLNEIRSDYYESLDRIKDLEIENINLRTELQEEKMKRYLR